jgi:hypothetical protein
LIAVLLDLVRSHNSIYVRFADGTTLRMNSLLRTPFYWARHPTRGVVSGSLEEVLAFFEDCLGDVNEDSISNVSSALSIAEPQSEDVEIEVFEDADGVEVIRTFMTPTGPTTHSFRNPEVSRVDDLTHEIRPPSGG